ncbi:MAG TPA: molybdopterin-guanine dinucleotide biosynthesis protein B [Burkholderiaceae bacterium]|nr:molybdopterin-guanine dinucleotide biosynthesis protein B [Burkholderiaceae bacterium]
MKAIGFIGYSNSGKTTLIEKLIPIFRAQGLSVSAVKNAHHGFDMDRPGKDSFRYRVAGAQQVLIATSSRWALLSETPQRAATLDELLRELGTCDLVIVEGFKSEGNIPRIEVRRSANVDPPIFPHDSNVVALATDHTVQSSVPILDLNDPDEIAVFIAQLLQLPARRV